MFTPLGLSDSKAYQVLKKQFIFRVSQFTEFKESRVDVKTLIPVPLRKCICEIKGQIHWTCNATKLQPRNLTMTRETFVAINYAITGIIIFNLIPTWKGFREHSSAFPKLNSIHARRHFHQTEKILFNLKCTANEKCKSCKRSFVQRILRRWL